MKRLQWFSRHQWWSLAGILAGFSAISLGNMTRWSIWYDEAFSLYLMRFDYAKIAYFTGKDVHPPLYYWFLKFWTDLLHSTSPIVVRSLSLVFACVALIGVYVLVRRILHSRGYALLATLACSLTPLLIRYSEEARMYMLAFAIVVWATYAMLRAMERNSRKWWLVYALLVMAGMLTHYLIALAWITHWIWRFVTLRKNGGMKMFFSKEWIGAYALAILLYAWWIPKLIAQYTSVQHGFWIPGVTLATPLDYLSNTLIYRMTHEAGDWWTFLSLAVIVIVLFGFWQFVKFARVQKKADRPWARLLIMLAWLPPLLLALLSMPPLKSTFIDRYTLYAGTMLLALAVIGLAVYGKRERRRAAIMGIVLLVGLISGIVNVYQIGNFNKNSNTSVQTGAVMRQIAQNGPSGTPVIGGNAWIYYEMAAYDSRETPTYFLASSLPAQDGSVTMLRESEMGKINDLDAFTKTHRYIWYLDSNEQGITAPVSTWKTVKDVGVYDPIMKVTKYRAVLYDTQAN